MTKTYKLEGKIKITTEGGDFSAEVPADEIRRLLKENPELLEEKGYKPWRAEEGGQYWYVTGGGSVNWLYEKKDNIYAEFHYLTGNYFATREEAEAHKARLEAIGRVTHAILEANEGWEPDWSDEDEKKYYLFYSHSWNQFDWGAMGPYQDTQTLPYAKSSEIVNNIIAEHEADLRIIFNVK